MATSSRFAAQLIRRFSSTSPPTVGHPCRRLLAISDLHVDLRENLDIVQGWSTSTHRDDVLIVAGDVTDDLTLLTSTLKTLTDKFSLVFFVPGNHELWIKPNHEKNTFSSEKFTHILRLCESLGVQTCPQKLHIHGDVMVTSRTLWVVPLFTWYTRPEDNIEDTLYSKPESGKDDKELDETVWPDNHLCDWSNLAEGRLNYVATHNEERLRMHYDAPVVTFSHFLPRTDLIQSSPLERKAIVNERCRLGLESKDFSPAEYSPKCINFSRFAGCKSIDRHVRHLKSVVHFYGHQHRNRDRVIDGVRYVSHCLGFKKERNEGFLSGIRDSNFGPKQIWPFNGRQ